MVTGSNTNSMRQDAEAVLRPDPRKHAGQIFGWVFCWPWDLAWTLFVNNPLRHFSRVVVREIRATLDDITRGELREIESDLNCDPPPATVLPVPTAVPSIIPEAIAQRANVEAGVTPQGTRKAGEIGSLGPLYAEDPWYATGSQGLGWHVGNDGSATGSHYGQNTSRPQDR